MHYITQSQKYALVSVSDKVNLIELINTLKKYDYKIISTGGTYKFLTENNISCIEISDYTKFEEILNGRVKTLHPIIHAGILSLRNNPEHERTLKKLNINHIDVVVVNLYPFEQTINNESHTEKQAIENIDIGGPSMIRSAAKNFESVAVITDPNDYSSVIENLNHHQGQISEDIKKYLMIKAFALTSYYDSLIANYFANKQNNFSIKQIGIPLKNFSALRYGENPHQHANLYLNASADQKAFLNCSILNGKELSYNNWVDFDAAYKTCLEFDLPTCVVIKHATPCAIASSSSSLYEAWKKAYEADPVSIFGGIVCFNQKITSEIAKELVNIFLELVIAEDFENEALELLKTKKNLRIIKIKFDKTQIKNKTEYKSVGNGILIQNSDFIDNQEIYQATKVTTRKFNEGQLDNALFAWKVVKSLKSNAIAICKNMQTIGLGFGQTNRIASCNLAIEQARNHLDENCVLASDGFFPMKDSIELISKTPIKYIVQPGNSIKDKEVIEECNKNDIAMIFTHKRHFLH